MRCYDGVCIIPLCLNEHVLRVSCNAACAAENFEDDRTHTIRSVALISLFSFIDKSRMEQTHGHLTAGQALLDLLKVHYICHASFTVIALVSHPLFTRNTQNIY